MEDHSDPESDISEVVQVTNANCEHQKLLVKMRQFNLGLKRQTQSSDKLSESGEPKGTLALKSLSEIPVRDITFLPPMVSILLPLHVTSTSLFSNNLPNKVKVKRTETRHSVSLPLLKSPENLIVNGVQRSHGGRFSWPRFVEKEQEVVRTPTLPVQDSNYTCGESLLLRHYKKYKERIARCKRLAKTS